MNLIEFRGIAKTYGAAGAPVFALKKTDLTIARGRFVAIMGPSGSGKSTLLNLVGLLDKPTCGEYILDGENVADLDDDAMAEVRCRKIGMVFQSFNLFPRFTVLENVCVPMQYADVSSGAMLARARELLGTVGLGSRTHHRPTQLSGGEKQRVAIARSLANDPALLLADEPTGNLDARTGQEIMAIFRELVAKGKTIVMVTHNPEYEEYAERVIRLRDGEVLES